MAKSHFYFSKLVLLVCLVIFPFSLWAQSVCENYSYAPSQESQREQLLNQTKRNLLRDARSAMSNLERARNDFQSCNDQNCQEFAQTFLTTVREQYQLAKIARAIAELPRALQGGIRSPRTVGDMLIWIQHGHIHAVHIANLNIDGLTFSESLQEKMVEMWTHVFIRTARVQPNANLRDIIESVRHYFEYVAETLNFTNPLLAFMEDSQVETFNEIINALDRLIQFNEDFINTIQGLQTRHSRSFWSYPNLTLRDHEMRLVNFNTQIESIIASHSNPNSQRLLCNAWEDLKRQQTRRIRSSIGVGFATSVVCGVGIWSGLGTIPALMVCAPALADGLWGAQVGRTDARLAGRALLAGREIFGAGQFTDGILSPEVAMSQQRRANIVFLVNITGLIPITRAISMAQAGTRGRLLDLFTLPFSDVTVSATEVSAANLVYLAMVLKGTEALQFEYQDELNALIDIWENRSSWRG